MPGVDFDKLRAQITMEQVLNAIGFVPTSRQGNQWYGACPLHPGDPRHRRCFSVNVAIGRFHCHRCHAHGHQLELWAAFTGRRLHQAAIDLCHLLGRQVPWIDRW